MVTEQLLFAGLYSHLPKPVRHLILFCSFWFLVSKRDDVCFRSHASKGGDPAQKGIKPTYRGSKTSLLPQVLSVEFSFVPFNKLCIVSLESDIDSARTWGIRS
jgi:hypothetical protein